MKAQVSFEFMVLFVIVFALFVAISQIIPDLVGNAKPVEEQANILADDLQRALITASLAPSNFETEISLPDTLEGDTYTLTIENSVAHVSDNFVSISVNFNLVARRFVPIIETNNYQQGDRTLTIRKANGMIEVASS